MGTTYTSKSYAYLDANGDVVGRSAVARELTDPECVAVNAVERIDNAPAELRYKGEVDVYHTKVSGDGTDISHYTTTDTLKQKRNRKVKKIDKRTTELIEAGFTYDGKIFSLSRQAQSNLLGVQANINKADRQGVLAAFEAAVFPLTFNTLDDEDTVELATIVEFDQFYDTAFGTVKALLDSGTSLKDAIRTANSKAEIDAVVDNR